ncbi:phage tail assembly chaperone [Aureimonas jatrophae]|uniref:Phage tail assembly chaperone protein, TAC n=1 Tax=Aureimonas jatrophae TaxID=1166073 RepID=A0A1H0CQ73_9HYPH|nr:phage tail assembly chaperone [Aureimonas jatrophae]MBB3949334.1 putative phage protein (TIGR02216 family) [Aureimonas jatrophae]SDN60034.1 phage conserved hypothetical protein [Aureimonas jatrophae]
MTAAAPEGEGAAAFPWDRAMRAVLALGLSPADFWRLAPRELAVLLDAHAPATPGRPDRAGLDALMQRFPDGG